MASTPLDTDAAPDVRDLDAAAVLDAVASARRAADAEEARLLALAVHWVDLHPVTSEHPAATFPTQRTGGLASALGPGFFAPAPLAGDGTPAVAEYAVEELAAALNLSHAAGLSWSRRPSSSATGCRGCGRWSRAAGCRRGGPARSPRPPPSSPGTRWRSWTDTSPSPAGTTGCPP